MTLAQVVTAYITLKQSMGMHFHTEAASLKAFCRSLGEIDIREVQPQPVLAFLSGKSKGPVTATWHLKFKILNGFYRFALRRGYVDSCPLPRTLPKCPPPLKPYIYTLQDLRRLLDATDSLRTRMSPLQATTMRTLFLLLYATGLRISEALSLTLADVQLEESLLLIRDSKFYKTRWVPTGSHLTLQLEAYAKQRGQLPLPQGKESAFFCTRTGRALSYGRATDLFRRLRSRGGIRREARARYQPRISDFRHTFAVHRLVSWYRQGADVQRLLPHLSTYLGHVKIEHTQRYLSMTPELLTEASKRFQRYAFSEVPHVP